MYSPATTNNKQESTLSLRYFSLNLFGLSAATCAIQMPLTYRFTFIATTKVTLHYEWHGSQSTWETQRIPRQEHSAVRGCVYKQSAVTARQLLRHTCYADGVNIQYVRTSTGWPSANVAGKITDAAKTNLLRRSQVIKKAMVYLSIFISFQTFQLHAETLSNND
jgi:hypothetical protein